jgi:hypothetical protein
MGDSQITEPIPPIASICPFTQISTCGICFLQSVALLSAGD